MGLRFDPMGGGQLKQALNAIIESERQPINALQKRKDLEQAKLKLFGEFKTKFSSLQSTLGSLIGFNKFKELKAELGDGISIMDVRLDKEKANVGSWEFAVKELAERSSMISNGFTDPNEHVLGMGYITVQLTDGDTQDVYVLEEESSLNGIAGKINSISDSSIKATVLKDVSNTEAPYRLVLSAKTEGLEHEVVFPQLYFVNGAEDFYIDSDKDSKNALIEVDGFEIEAESNDVPDFFQGVSVQFKQAKPDQKFTLSIKADYQKVAEKVKKVVEGVNGVLEFINKQNQVNESSDTRSTFAGDTSLQNVEFRLRNLMHHDFGSHLNNEDLFKAYHLSELGIEFNKTGMLEFKEDKFQKQMELDFDGIAEVMSGEMGFISQLKTVMDGFASPATGILNSRERGMQDRIKQIDSNIANKERYIEKKTASLTDQFSRLQGALSSMQKQQQYLTATMGGGGGNPVSQLLGG